ncbi:MAG: hypothetical protein M9894_07365 [Planctomycetes bacterium]|nr:hypothetical protein [Planctomycetota bacterium]
MTAPMHHDVPLDLGLASPDAVASQGPRQAPVRWALVQRVRREIARGTYETPERWEGVVARLVAEGVV